MENELIELPVPEKTPQKDTFAFLHNPIADGQANIGAMTDEELELYINSLYANSEGFFASYARNRFELGRALTAMKNRLCKPGCKGQWKPFLEKTHISDSSATRLIEAYKVYSSAPQLLLKRAWELGIDLFVPRVSAVLADINEEVGQSTVTIDDVERFIDRLEGVGSHGQKKNGGTRSARTLSANVLAEKITKLRNTPPVERPDRLRDLVMEITAFLGEGGEYDVIITRRCDASSDS